MRKALFFLGILNDTDIDWMIASGIKREVAPGTAIIREGEGIDSLFLVLDGAFRVTSRGVQSDLARRQSGEILGEISFVDRRPPMASVIAAEPSIVLAIPRAKLERHLVSDSGFASRFYHALATFLADRLRGSTASSGKTEAGDDLDEIEPDTLDRISLAGTRFEWLRRRVNGS